jgi:hypothetical protein
VRSATRHSWIFALIAGLMVSFTLIPQARADVLARTEIQTPQVTLVTMQKVGNPAWVPVDPHMFSAPIGTASDGYAEFGQTMATLLPPPHYKNYPGIGIGPGTPESPPYNHDLADGVSQAGYSTGPVFLPQQFSNGMGVYFVYMVVPSPRTTNVGSSPDYSSGPIIPNSLFPITANGVTYRNGQTYDPYLASISVPAMNDPAWNPPFNVDGFSHFPIFVADNSDFGPPGVKLPGLYGYKLTMRDALGNGWNLSATFIVG